MLSDKLTSSFECLSDVSTEEDKLGFNPYVEAVAEFLTAEGTRPPITLSIEGKWGCGKSSFMKQLEKNIKEKNINELREGDEGELQNQRSYIDKLKTIFKSISSKLFPIGKKQKYFTVWFNAWRYEKEDELWASFALNFIEELSKQLPWYYKIISQFKLIWRRYRIRFNYRPAILTYILLRTASFIIIFLFLFLVTSYILKFLGMSTSNGLTIPLLNPHKVENFASIITLLTSFIVVVNHFFSKEPLTDLLSDPFGLRKLESNIGYKERLPFREHFYSDFDEIIKSYVGKSKVYVFIDDLDRAQVPKAAELMQAINLMISEDSNVYFSIGMDRKIISAGLAVKSEKVISYLDLKGLEYGYDFIEKFIQLPFKVPSPKNTDFLKFLMPTYEKGTPLNSSEPVNNSITFDELTLDKSTIGNSKFSHEENKEQEKRINNRNNVIPELNTLEIHNDSDCVDNYEASKIILEMVSPALDNNPRRIKQFINQFRFQRTIGKRTGLFSYDERTYPDVWNCKKLAKFVAISIKWPSLLSTLSLNITFLEELQKYALQSENNNEEIGKQREVEENKSLEEWIKDKKLKMLLRYGCVEGNTISKNINEYTLSGLDFSKLLEISPEVDFILDIEDIQFVLIRPGEFIMGSNKDEPSREGDEGPVHKVVIKNPFYLGKYPVTQRQWIAIMGSNPSHFKGDDLPVENVSWNDAQKFIEKLNKIEGTTRYRLPSEAEWEYACRAGTTTRFYFGNNESKIGDYMWHRGNASDITHPVGQKNPNKWDLYDMHGNVWEWVQDIWSESYNETPVDGSAWEEKPGSNRVLRGGSWVNNVGNCRSASRNRNYPEGCSNSLGFRLLKELN